MSHYDADDDGFVLCSQDMKPMDTDGLFPNEIIKECPYSEDVYCKPHFNEHMEEYHPYYYSKVLHIKTQHRDKTKATCEKRIKEYTRAGKIIQCPEQPIYWVAESKYGKVPKFDYTEVSHAKFMEIYYPAFARLKGVGGHTANREATC